MAKGSSGGTTTQIIQPTPAPQPSTADAIKQYVESLPELYEAQLKYAPLEAQQQVDLAQQYAQPLAESYQTAQEQLYPGTSALQEQLVTQAREGATGQVPQSLQDQYRSDLNAQLGTNVGSGIGADYVSRNLINQQLGYQQYYQNLGLSLAGRQPLVNPQTPGYTNQLGSFNPGQALGYTASNYGTFSAANRPIVTQNQQGVPNWMLGLQAGAGIAQGIGQAGGAAAFFCWIASALYGGWHKADTVACRVYLILKGPIWFRRLYTRYGWSWSRSRLMLTVLAPLFRWFAHRGRKMMAYGTVI